MAGGCGGAGRWPEAVEGVDGLLSIHCRSAIPGGVRPSLSPQALHRGALPDLFFGTLTPAAEVRRGQFPAAAAWSCKAAISLTSSSPSLPSAHRQRSRRGGAPWPTPAAATRRSSWSIWPSSGDTSASWRCAVRRLQLKGDVALTRRQVQRGRWSMLQEEPGDPAGPCRRALLSGGALKGQAGPSRSQMHSLPWMTWQRTPRTACAPSTQWRCFLPPP